MSRRRRLPFTFRPALRSALITATVIAAAAGITAPAHAKEEVPIQAQASQDDLPSTAQELTPQILYQFLLAEIATQRGQYPLAMQAYLDLARTTRDVRVAKRSAEIGLHSRQYELAIEAAKLWNTLQPEDPAANQMLANLFVATQRSDDLAATLERDLANAGTGISTALLRLNRVLARYTDKTAVMQLVDRVTVPYLNIPEARFVRAQAAANVKDGLRTMAEIDQALALRPAWEMAALFKFQQLPAGASATDFASRYLREHAQAQDLRLAYARALVGEKRYDEAQREFRTLSDAQPDNAEITYAVGVLALQLNNLGEAEVQLKKVAGLNQARADAARYYLGQLAEAGNRPDDAVQWYREVNDDEQRLPAILRGVQLLAERGQVAEAREWLHHARQQEPAESPRLFIIEAQLLRERGTLADMQSLLNQGLHAHPDHPDLLYESGLAAERLGDTALMEQRFRRLIEIRPDSAQGYNALGYSLAERNMHLQEAERLIDKALTLSPNDYYILDSKGWLLFRQGKLPEALEYLKRAYAIRAEPEIAAHIGEVLWVQGKHEDAKAVWHAADKANPGNSDLLSTMKRFGQ